MAFLNFVLVIDSCLTLNVSLSAIEISTCGVRKCIGGVPLSAERNESPLSLYVGPLLLLPLAPIFVLFAAFAAAAAAANAMDGK